MGSERLLGTFLRSLQTYTEHQDTPRLLGTASSLLTSLHNPLNITLLTHQILTAPALWERPSGLQLSLRVLSVFHSAAAAINKREDQALEEQGPTIWGTAPPPEGIAKEEWLKAVIRGADDRSPRWRHLLVLGGLLIGFGPVEDERLSPSLRRALEEGLVQAANIALVKVREENDELGAQSIALVLNHTFPLLPDFERGQLNYDVLLPILVGSAFFSKEGLRSSYFLATVDLDVEEKDGKLHWPADSQSFQLVNETLKSPLVSSLGPLSRLIAHCTEQVTDAWLIRTMIEDLKTFSFALVKQWRMGKLCHVHPAKEAESLTEETAKTTMVALWRVLRSTLFAVVVVLRGALGRLVKDRSLAADDVAPTLVCHTLHILRNFYFITSRLGSDSFTQYTFTYLTAIDVLTRYPIVADTFIKECAPLVIGEIPPDPLERALDLFFLNTAEHFTLILSPQTNEDLLVASASPYLAAGGASDLLLSFEAAHSVMLAVMSAPQSATLTAKHLPFYIDALFLAFPENLSPRQFRLAFKTLLRVLAPPSLLTAMQPDLPGTLLELLHFRALTAPTSPLQQKYNGPESPIPNNTPKPQFAALQQALLSEQAVLVLTLLDSLPYLPIELLEEWLPLAADLVHKIPDPGMQSAAKRRFWEVIVSGEMDPERCEVCVAWWSSRGGREMVLFGPTLRGEAFPEGEEVVMSGALQKDGVGESKL